MYISYKAGKNYCTALVERVMLKKQDDIWTIMIWTVGFEKAVKEIECSNYDEALLKYNVFASDLNAIDIGEVGDNNE